ncbi:MAG TPA: zinc permease [Actinobacteria bacterium]|nr:zinc permease [Actinomycetota bacterium]
MTIPETVLLGALAGSTIFLGLPLGRLKAPHPRLKAFLNAASAGILIFLLFDILSNATRPLEALVDPGRSHLGPALLSLPGLFVVYAAGLAAGLLSLLYLGKYQKARRAARAVSLMAVAATGPSAVAVADAHEARQGALHLGMSIAAGIGLHNFSEGLAIGQSARGGELSLAVLLVVGFALHNATEGFGIVGPLAAGGVQASWTYLLTAGLVAGAPTFLGTLVGSYFTNQYVFVGFLTLAAGAIIYVIAELLNTGRRLGAWDITVWGVLAGFLLGLVTELVIVAAGV